MLFPLLEYMFETFLLIIWWLKTLTNTWLLFSWLSMCRILTIIVLQFVVIAFTVCLFHKATGLVPTGSVFCLVPYFIPRT